MDPKIAYFVVRYNGFQYFQEIIDFIESSKFEFRIYGVLGIKWRKEETRARLYRIYADKFNNPIALQDILDRNSNVLIGIICKDYHPKPSTPDTHSDNHNTVIVKRHFRSEYGNILHVSDNVELAYREIELTTGLDRNMVNAMITVTPRSLCSVGRCESHDNLLKIFNKIEDGRVVLWKP